MGWWATCCRRGLTSHLTTIESLIFHPAVSSGAFQGRGHMKGLSLHPSLHLSYHLTHSQRVTAVDGGPVLTHAALLGQTRDTKEHQYSLPSGSFRLTLTRILYLSLIPTLMAKVDPGSKGRHRHSPNWWAKLRSRQHGTRAPRIPASTREAWR